MSSPSPQPKRQQKKYSKLPHTHGDPYFMSSTSMSSLDSDNEGKGSDVDNDDDLEPMREMARFGKA